MMVQSLEASESKSNGCHFYSFLNGSSNIGHVKSIEGLGKMLIVQSLILFARWYTKMLLMTVGDKTCLKFTQEFTQVFEMQNLKVLQDSFKKSEILQILEMLHFKIIQIFRLST